MNEEHVLELFKYHQWANDRLLKHIKSLPEEVYQMQLENVFSSIADAFYHIYSVDFLWLKRCDSKLISNVNTTNFESIESAESNLKELYEVWERYVTEQYHELNTISYQNSTGATFTNNLDEIIRHIVNHGTYHRGNIASMIRQLGYNGTSTDYIVFLRHCK